MINSILCEIGSWLIVKKEFKDYSMTVFIRD